MSGVSLLDRVPFSLGIGCYKARVQPPRLMAAITAASCRYKPQVQPQPQKASSPMASETRITKQSQDTGIDIFRQFAETLRSLQTLQKDATPPPHQPSRLQSIDRMLMSADYDKAITCVVRSFQTAAVEKNPQEWREYLQGLRRLFRSMVTKTQTMQDEAKGLFVEHTLYERLLSLSSADTIDATRRRSLNSLIFSQVTKDLERHMPLLHRLLSYPSTWYPEQPENIRLHLLTALTKTAKTDEPLHWAIKYCAFFISEYHETMMDKELKALSALEASLTTSSTL